MILGQIGQHHLQRTQHGHGTRRAQLQIFADAEFEHGHIDHAIALAQADAVAEVANRGRRVAATTQTGDGRHARIIPAVYQLLVHQLLELALAGHGVIQVEAGKLDLLRMRQRR